MRLGCDPEVMCFMGSMPVSAIGRLPGEKHSPYKLSLGTCHPDNVMAEFNANPADSAEEFSKIVQTCMDDMGKVLKGCTIGKGMSAWYPDAELQHPDACVSGCNPDFNAWMYGGENAPPDMSTPLRSAGGHVHIGHTITDPIKFVQCCDLYLSIPAMKAEDPARRMLYGMAGSYRVKPYGVEYRTFGNHWIWEDRTRQWVFNQVQEICRVYETIRIPELLPEIINNHDLDKAAEIMQQYNLTQYPAEH